MGPRRRSRGRLYLGRYSSPRKPRFNGATTKESWKTRSSRRHRIRSSRFNGATTKESWKTLDGAHEHDCGHERFNGATTKESWKTTST